MMHSIRTALVLLCSSLAVAAWAANDGKQDNVAAANTGTAKPCKTKIEKIRKSDRQWRKELSRKAYAVTREGKTETARTGRYWRYKVKGTYLCVCCEESDSRRS